MSNSNSDNTMAGVLADAQTGGVVGRNAVENNFLYSQTAREKGLLTTEENALLARLAQAANAPSIEYFIREREKIMNGQHSAVEKQRLLHLLDRRYQEASQRMTAAAAALPRGSKDRGLLFTIASKMVNIVPSLPPYEQSGYIRQEKTDWIPSTFPIMTPSGFSAVQREWGRRDGLSEEAVEVNNNAIYSGGRLGLTSRNATLNHHTVSLAGRNAGKSAAEQAARSRPAQTERVPSPVDGEMAGGNKPIIDNDLLKNNRPHDVAFAQRPIRTLVQDDNGRYWLQSSSGQRITPSGKYDFVTMPDGTIRVSRSNTNPEFSTHLGLSGGQNVRYAGSIRFGNNTGPNRGKIISWTNDSGHYTPPESKKGNANLPIDLFRRRSGR